MGSIHPVSLGIAAFWTCSVLLALYWSRLSASAGHLPRRWESAGMIFALLSAALVLVATWLLPLSVPRIIRRTVQLVGMFSGLWAAGTITRAIYALCVLHQS